MRKILINKKLSVMLSTLIAITVLSITSTCFAAINNNYVNATSVSLSSTITTDAITSANAEVWYKFTIPTAGAAYSFTLRNMPTSNPYNFELRYQTAANTRPVILRNLSTLTTTNRRTMTGVLDNVGTYYIRVYSMTGEFSTTPYTFSVSVGYGGYTITLNNVTNAPERLDWAACAEMVGKQAFQRSICSTAPSRTYLNAAKFIQTTGTSDSASPAPTNVRRTLDQTATATSYIFAGDYMTTPNFASETGTVYQPVDFVRTIWAKDRSMIIRLTDKDSGDGTTDIHYVALLSAWISDNEIEIYDPWISSAYTVDYDDFITNGYEGDGYLTVYSGENVIYNVN